MAQKTLTTSYLARLSNANHDGVTQQIDDRFAAFETATDCSASLLRDVKAPSLRSATLLRGHKTASIRSATPL